MPSHVPLLCVSHAFSEVYNFFVSGLYLTSKVFGVLTYNASGDGFMGLTWFQTTFITICMCISVASVP